MTLLTLATIGQRCAF